MKKFIIIFGVLLFCSTANAEIVLMQSNVTTDNYWQKSNIEVQKVTDIARKLIHENNLKRASVSVARNWRVVNASTSPYTKAITVDIGLLPYITNDDEMAFILGHELAHAQEAYEGAVKVMSMTFNSKKYEYKADLKSIDYMVKSGYNPIAGIIIGDKIFEEPLWDWGFTYSHPKGSKRLVKMYEYIYKKYPAYLNSDMAKSDAFVDFLNQNDKELSSFKQKQAKKGYTL